MKLFAVSYCTRASALSRAASTRFRSVCARVSVARSLSNPLRYSAASSAAAAAVWPAPPASAPRRAVRSSMVRLSVDRFAAPARGREDAARRRVRRLLRQRHRLRSDFDRLHFPRRHRRHSSAGLSAALRVRAAGGGCRQQQHNGRKTARVEPCLPALRPCCLALASCRAHAR